MEAPLLSIAKGFTFPTPTAAAPDRPFDPAAIVEYP
jgi:hypothetical protein